MLRAYAYVYAIPGSLGTQNPRGFGGRAFDSPSPCPETTVHPLARYIYMPLLNLIDIETLEWAGALEQSFLSKRSQYVVYLQAVTKFDRANSSATSPPKCCRASPKSSRPLRLVRGPNVKVTIAPRKIRLRRSIQKGGSNTRDLARLENGYLFIVGRTKELIVRFGENVYPAEVEALLNSHPAVVGSAVIGRAVEGTEGGEEVVAFVQLVPSLPTSEAELA
jgi:acyl-CoA synthetase (AMP-forming)/AMP-acid ligase II